MGISVFLKDQAEVSGLQGEENKASSRTHCLRVLRPEMLMIKLLRRPRWRSPVPSFAFFTNCVRFVYTFRRAVNYSSPAYPLSKDKEELPAFPAPR